MLEMNILKDRLEKGLYWQRAWKLVEGCTKVSPACDNCWSETETGMRSRQDNKKISERAKAVMTRRSVIGDVFNGLTLMRDDNLYLPLKTKKQTVFAIWNDLYHEDITDEFRDKAYAVMALCPQHEFLICTKRAEGMSEYAPFINGHFSAEKVERMDAALSSLSVRQTKNQKNASIASMIGHLDNVWHGVTVENQVTADLRIRYLLQVPGNRFLSIEPMLSSIDLIKFFKKYGSGEYGCSGAGEQLFNDFIHAIILGGESGKNARPMHPDWVRSLRDQCVAGGVPLFFKQHGQFVVAKRPYNPSTDITLFHDGTIAGTNFTDEYLKNNNAVVMRKTTKQKAGRMLDGRKYDDLPWVRPKNHDLQI